MVNLMSTSLNTKNNMKLCECYKLNELKDKYPNDMEFGREARKLTVDGRIAKIIAETPNDFELGTKLRNEKI
jgi:hypothetical protein